MEVEARESGRQGKGKETGEKQLGGRKGKWIFQVGLINSSHWRTRNDGLTKCCGAFGRDRFLIVGYVSSILKVVIFIRCPAYGAHKSKGNMVMYGIAYAQTQRQVIKFEACDAKRG